ASPRVSTLSLPDALPISVGVVDLAGRIRRDFYLFIPDDGDDALVFRKRALAVVLPPVHPQYGADDHHDEREDAQHGDQLLALFGLAALFRTGAGALRCAFRRGRRARVGTLEELLGVLGARLRVRSVHGYSC